MEQASSPSLFWAPAMSLLIFQKMPPQSRPIARAMTQCMSSSVGLRMISVKVRLYRTASSRVMGVRGGFLCCNSSYCISLACPPHSLKATARRGYRIIRLDTFLRPAESIRAQGFLLC